VLAVLIGLLPALAPAQEAPVAAVTLFAAGLAEITRDADGQERVTLRVPLRDVNDVLKSLLVRGPGVTGARLALDGPSRIACGASSAPCPRARRPRHASSLNSGPR
jgi:hypothetical protein